MLRRFGAEFRPSYVGIGSYDKERFLAKYAEAIPAEGPLETPCLRWPYAIASHGYGLFSYEGKLHRAHRVAWLVFKGEIPFNHNICHACDNTWCVRIEHLFVDTQLGNISDMIAKGRKATPQQFHGGSVKLTADQAREIYNLAWSGRYMRQDIGNKFGITARSVRKIKSRQSWNCLWDERSEWTTPVLTELSPQEWEQMKSGPGEWKDVVVGRTEVVKATQAHL